ncbi:MAG: FAD-dependent oxidoreductase [Saprospiraceae bacterium]|nr:FAD-dependent oxidoreductase [Saprospiraceae bacterium]
MKRRRFLNNSLWGAFGGMLIPGLSLSACEEESLLDEEVNYDGKVLIIGAGAAGLYAGYLLKSKNIDFQILEASGRYGGRLGKLNGFADYPLDLGAQWLHGKNSIAGEWASQMKAKITLDDSDEYFWFNSQIKETLPKDIGKIFTREHDLPDISFKEFAIGEGFGNDFKDIVEAIAGDSGAAASRISAYWKIKEEENWNSGDDDYKFQETYFDLINDQIVGDIKDHILLNRVVKGIDYSGTEILVTDQLNNTYSADKILITVPITILKSNAIQFNPTLPTDRTTAFSKIGMDAGMKVFLKFSDQFYHQNIIGGQICGAYADESIGKAGDDHILLAFIMGSQAEYLNSLETNDLIVKALLGELDSMYNGLASPSYIGSHVENWTKNPFIQGAYSYSTVGMGNARHIAAQSIDDKIFFGGEAMNLNGHHQTVHGALETGHREVLNILKSIK